MLPTARLFPTSYVIGLPQSCDLGVAHKYSVCAIFGSPIPPLNQNEPRKIRGETFRPLHPQEKLLRQPLRRTYAAQSPKQMPRSRAVSMVSQSNGTVFIRLVADSSGT
jgi:hypothetical protein